MTVKALVGLAALGLLVTACGSGNSGVYVKGVTPRSLAIALQCTKSFGPDYMAPRTKPAANGLCTIRTPGGGFSVTNIYTWPSAAARDQYVAQEIADDKQLNADPTFSGPDDPTRELFVVTGPGYTLDGGGLPKDEQQLLAKIMDALPNSQLAWTY